MSLADSGKRSLREYVYKTPLDARVYRFDQDDSVFILRAAGVLFAVSEDIHEDL